MLNNSGYLLLYDYLFSTCYSTLSTLWIWIHFRNLCCSNCRDMWWLAKKLPDIKAKWALTVFCSYIMAGLKAKSPPKCWMWKVKCLQHFKYTFFFWLHYFFYTNRRSSTLMDWSTKYFRRNLSIILHKPIYSRMHQYANSGPALILTFQKTIWTITNNFCMKEKIKSSAWKITWSPTSHVVRIGSLGFLRRRWVSEEREGLSLVDCRVTSSACLFQLWCVWHMN